jgi:hypothetical protein
MKALLFFGVLASASSALQSRAPTLPEFLKSNQFTEADLREIESGKAVAKLIEAEEDTETRILGVVKIRGDPEDFIARQRDVVRFEQGAGVLEIGLFSDPAAPADLAGLTLGSEDIEDLKGCKPGDCGLKLGDPAIEAFRRIDWQRPDAVSSAEKIARQMIVDFLNVYRKGGNEALSTFHDKSRPLLVKEQFEEMIAARDLPEYFPRLHAFLKDYPEATIPEGEEIFYWSKVDFGLKPVIRLNHLVIYQPRNMEAVRYVVASKMIYTSHYFNTGLESKFLVASEESPASYYMVSVNQSRSDGLTGFIGRIAGGKIRDKAREGSESYLGAVKKMMEGGAS